MPKLFIFFSSLLISFIFFVFLITPKAYGALVSCGEAQALDITDPANPIPLASKKGIKGSFTVDVSGVKDSAIASYKMEFLCAALGIKQEQLENIKLNSDGKTITGELENVNPNINPFSGPVKLGTLNERCEFDPKANLKIKVKGAIPRRGDVDLCEATYKVVDPNQSCKLDLREPGGSGTVQKITLGTPLVLNGEGLAAGDKFFVVIDNKFHSGSATEGISFNDAIKLINPFSNAPTGPRYEFQIEPKSDGTFNEYSIPEWARTPGSHNITIHNVPTIFNANPLGSKIGPPLCSLTYSVGTDIAPGGVIASGSADLGTVTTPQKRCKRSDESFDPLLHKNCSTASGLSCNPSTGQNIINAGKASKGIMTAIGCVPTEPKAFVEGVLRFVSLAAGGIALVLMLLGALSMITAEGNPELLNHAKERFYSAIIGLLVIIFSVVLLQFIGVDILGLPGFIK